MFLIKLLFSYLLLFIGTGLFLIFSLFFSIGIIVSDDILELVEIPDISIMQYRITCILLSVFFFFLSIGIFYFSFNILLTI